jgi:putative ABC transport system permease protein
VEWRRLEPNFFVVFPEGVLEKAPKFYVAAVRAPTPGDSARLQRAVVGAFPNTTAIDVTLVRDTLDGIFSKIATAIQFMAMFTAAAALAVLAGAMLSARRQRRRESALLRTLGAAQRQIATMELVENAVLGGLGATIGCLLACVANGMMARFLFRTAAADPLMPLVTAVAAVTAIAMLTGWLTNRGASRESPLDLLREEA